MTPKKLGYKAVARDHLFIYISDGHDWVEIACHGWVVVNVL